MFSGRLDQNSGVHGNRKPPLIYNGENGSPPFLGCFWFDFCFTALQHILGHFGRGQLTYPHCSWASLLGSLPVLSAHSFASNWQLLLLNQRKRENGRRNVFMTKSPRKNVPDVGIGLGAACMPSEHASDRATVPGWLLLIWCFLYLQVMRICIKSRTSSNFGQIGPLTTELVALEFLKAFP